jgi:hypothetical protein
MQIRASRQRSASVEGFGQWSFLGVGNGADVGPRIVDVRVSALRKELCDDRRHPTYIETVFGIGYRFREA